MKLQYLGDSRDAFKWDLLHWLCSRAAPHFSRLLFVPLLTRDDPKPTDGRTPHTRFPARPEIQAFVGSLRGHPDGLDAIRALGRIDSATVFDVNVHSPRTFVPDGLDRTKYWSALEPSRFQNTLVFLDPDNGFEIKSEKGGKWILDSEVAWLLCELPSSSAVVIYQHRPHRPWATVFEALTPRLQYAAYASAAYNDSVAFVLLARDIGTANRVRSAVGEYVKENPIVEYVAIKPSPNYALHRDARTSAARR